MASRLLKNDLKDTLSVLWYLYAFCLFIAGVCWILNTVDVSLFHHIYPFAAIFLVLILAAVAIVTVIYGWMYFANTMFQDASYFTHTIPLPLPSIFWTKTAALVILDAIGYGVMLLSIWIGIYPSIEEGLKLSFSMMDLNLGYIALLFLLACLLQFLFYSLLGLAGLCLGHRRSKNSMVWSVVWGFVLYLLCTLFNLAVMLSITWLSGDFSALMENTIEAGMLARTLYVALGCYLLVDCALAFIGFASLRRGFDVE